MADENLGAILGGVFTAIFPVAAIGMMFAASPAAAAMGGGSQITSTGGRGQALPLAGQEAKQREGGNAFKRKLLDRPGIDDETHGKIMNFISTGEGI